MNRPLLSLLDYLSSGRGARLILSLLVFFAMPLAGLLLTNKADPDLWMHLMTGSGIAETGGVPRRDAFSFSAAGNPWVSHEWLFQLLAFRVFSTFGAAGLLASKAAVGAAMLFFLYRQIALYSGVLAVRVFVFLSVSLVAVCLGFTCRPQIFTFLGLAFSLHLFHRARAGGDRERTLFALAPWLLLPWSWLHGGFAAGAGIFLIIAFGETLSGRPVRLLLTNTILASAATLLGPYGPRLWGRIYGTLSMPVLNRTMVEWQPFWASGVPLYKGCIVFFAALLLVCFAADKERRKNITVWLLAAAGLAAAVYSVRHLPLLALISAAPLAEGLERQRGKFRAGKPPARGFLCLFSLAALGLMCGLAAWIFYWTPVHRKIPPGAIVVQEAGPAWLTYPKGAVDFMRAGSISGRLWSDANVGAYLLWHLYPACRVFMDTRFEHVYTAGQMGEYAAAMAASDGWESILRKYRAELLLLPSGSPLAEAARRGGRRVLYRDPDYLLLAEKSAPPAGSAGKPVNEPALSPRPPLPWLFP